MALDKIVLATENPGKLAEFQAILDRIAVVPQSDYAIRPVAETGLTFAENAILKARNAAQSSRLPAVADDSGIEVDALAGEPGVYSARYAGDGASDEQNNNKLLQALQDVHGDKRRARFHCVIVLLRHAADPSPIIATGVWEGAILNTAVGENGFGYDSIFWVPEMGCSSAQLTPEDKNRLSHRGKALRQLLRAL